MGEKAAVVTNNVVPRSVSAGVCASQGLPSFLTPPSHWYFEHAFESITAA